jgi:nucleotide-binding universal stress UspA family protein
MNTTNQRAPIRRILLALDTATHSLVAVEAATALAARLDAELHALFVEDINLLRLAALPFARETHLTSATTRRLQDTDMEQALRAEATRAQTIRATVATRLHVRWSFQVTRGQMATQVREAALETDLVALSFAGGAPAGLNQVAVTMEAVMCGARYPLLMLPPRAAIRPPFVVVFGGSAASARALRLAVQLAQAEGQTVKVLLAATEPPVARRLRLEVDALLSGTKGTAQYSVLSSKETTALAHTVRASFVGTLLMAADSPVLDTAVRRRWLQDLACAVLLTR